MATEMSLLKSRYQILIMAMFFSLISLLNRYVSAAHLIEPRDTTVRLWAYSAAFNNAPMRVWDSSTDTLITTFVPRDGNGRGVAHDPTDGNIWTSTLLPGGFNGDGLIHKILPWVAPTLPLFRTPAHLMVPALAP